MLRRLRSDESGFTLIELVTAMSIGTIVLLAAFGLMDTVAKSQKRTEQRIDAVARGRSALEEITRQLRSQVCVSSTDPALRDTGVDSVAWYGSLAPAQAGYAAPPIELRRLSWVTDPGNPSRGRIVEEVFAGDGTPLPDTTFPGYPATPTRSRTLVDGIAKVAGGPLFRFYKYDAANAPQLVELTPPLSASDRQLTVKIAVTFDAYPQGSADARLRTVFAGDAFVRTADPTDPVHSPKCI